MLELVVVNSNVQLKQVADLLEDVDFGSTLNKLNSDWGLNRFLKGSTVACSITKAITPTINTPIDQAKPNDIPKPIVESFVAFSI